MPLSKRLFDDDRLCQPPILPQTTLKLPTMTVQSTPSSSSSMMSSRSSSSDGGFPPSRRGLRSSSRPSPIYDLWLESRVIRQPFSRKSHRDAAKLAQSPVLTEVYLRKGKQKPLSRANVGVAVRLMPHLLPRAARCLRPVWKEHKWHLFVYCFFHLVEGLLEPAKTYVDSAILDMVQISMTGGHLNPRHVLLYAGAGVLLAGGWDIAAALRARSSEVVMTRLNFHLRRGYVAAQLGLTFPQMTDKPLADLSAEAGAFAGRAFPGVETHITSPGHRFTDMIKIVGNAIGSGARILLLGRTLRKAMFGEAWYKRLLLVGLSITPALVRQFAAWYWRDDTSIDWNEDTETGKVKEDREIEDMAIAGKHRQEVILFGLHDWVLAKWTTLQHATMRSAYESARQTEWESMINTSSERAAQLAFDVVLALQLLSTRLTIGDINLCREISTDLFYQIQHDRRELLDGWQNIFLFAAYEAFIDWHADEARGSDLISYEDTRSRVGGQGMRLEARNLSFTYPGTSRPVVRNVSLTVEPGETLAIVGYNGAAKTSLVKALMGLYTVEGELSINDVPVQDISHATLHRRMSALFQDYGKYNLTVHDNVGLGDAGSGDLDAFDAMEVNMAIQRGGADGIVQQYGLDAYLDPQAAPAVALEKEEEHDELRENGGSAADARRDANPMPVALSGGQWQRVALARAFMRAEEADLIVFDEPSASLDPKAESELFQRIHALSRQGGRHITTIYISHRFSTVRKADKIAVVEEGQIIEMGSHAELMKLGGRYAELFTLQREGFEDT